MKKTQAALAALIALAAFGANAASVSTAIGVQSATTFVIDAGNTAGGLLLTAGQGNAAMPTGTVGTFLAAEPENDAVVTLGGVASVSFEWGTPDSTWNTLFVNLSNGTSDSFTPGSLALGSADTYVRFSALDGLTIKSLTFSENTNPAFEAANFKVTAVPEPTNVALLLAGLGMMGVVARRRRI
jgi:hypothetical protein